MFAQKFLSIFTIFVNFTWICHSIHFTDVTRDVFGGDQINLIAAFGDFNSDKLTDVFCIKNDGRTLEIFFGHSNIPLLQDAKLACTLSSEEKITSVMPGDFNGDSMMDVLVTVQSSDQNKLSQVRIFWGSLNNLNCTLKTIFTVKSQPLLMDYDGDMIPDIFTELENGTRVFWVAGRNGSFSPQLATADNPFRYPHSNAFLDLDFDKEPDLLITAEKKIEYFTRAIDGNKFELSTTFDYSLDYKVTGQSLFLDINGDGHLEHIMPVCKTSDCESCAIIARELNSSEWQVLIDTFKNGKDRWCFKQESTEFKKILIPMSLRSADLNMDGTPDFLVILDGKSGESKGKSKAVLITNNECTSCPFGRKLDILWNIIEGGDNAILAAPYDLYEDGIMDVLLTVKDEKTGKLSVKALQNKFTTDAYFIKVLVVGGLCYDNCPKNHIPYGTNQPGPFVMYKTLGPKGLPRIGAAVQLSQSAHFPLQLPYTVFGLGQTPNFVDELEVIVPGSSQNLLRKRQLTQIIPNSQIVIIPYPPDKPRYWTAKLFVTPSHLVLMTFAALIGTCVVICLIIAGLHWKERRQDKRERLLEAHRFHFDAM